MHKYIIDFVTCGLLGRHNQDNVKTVNRSQIPLIFIEICCFLDNFSGAKSTLRATRGSPLQMAGYIIGCTYFWDWLPAVSGSQ